MKQAESVYYMVVFARIPTMTDVLVRYATETAALVEAYGGQYLIRGGPEEILEGTWPESQRVIVSRWRSLSDLQSFWNSEEYQSSVKPLREGTGDYDVAVFPAV